MIVALLVLLMVLVVICTGVIVINLDRHTDRILSALRDAAPLSAQGGTFSQLFTAQAKARTALRSDTEKGA